MDLLQHDLGVEAANLTTKLLEIFWGNVQREVQTLEERDFQAIQFHKANSSDFGHVTVGEAFVFDVLHGHNNRNNQETVGVQRSNLEVRTTGNSQEIHHSAHKGLGMTVRVPRDPFEVLRKRDVGDRDRVEPGGAGVGVRNLIVDFNEAREHGRQKMNTILPKVLRLGDLQSH